MPHLPAVPTKFPANHNLYHTYSNNTRRRLDSLWNVLGSPIRGEAFSDNLGWSVSIYVDDNIVTTGSLERMISYSSTTNTWNLLGCTIIGLASEDQFGSSVSMSSDGNAVVAGDPFNDDDGPSSGQVEVFACSSTTTII